MSKLKLLKILIAIIISAVPLLAVAPVQAFSLSCLHNATGNGDYYTFSSPSCVCPKIDDPVNPGHQITDTNCLGYQEQLGNDCDKSKPASDCITHSGGFFETDVQPVVNVLSALVGVVVLGVIVFGGIQYSMAGDKPEALTAAKKHITNGLIALLIFMLLFTFLQFLLPGGIFK